MLGYIGAKTVTTRNYYGYTNPYNEDYVMDDVRCQGGEASLLQCQHITQDNCGHGEEAGVECEGQPVNSTSLPYIPATSTPLLATTPVTTTTTSTTTTSKNLQSTPATTSGMAQPNSGNLLQLTATPSDVTSCPQQDATITCTARTTDVTMATFMQMSKVTASGSVAPLVELVPGSQQPLFEDSSLITRSQVSGSLDVSTGVYLTLTLPTTVPADSGLYRCSLSYLGAAHTLELATAETQFNVWEPETLLSKVQSLTQELSQLQDTCARP